MYEIPLGSNSDALKEKKKKAIQRTYVEIVRNSKPLFLDHFNFFLPEIHYVNV